MALDDTPGAYPYESPLLHPGAIEALVLAASDWDPVTRRRRFASFCAEKKAHRTPRARLKLVFGNR